MRSSISSPGLKGRIGKRVITDGGTGTELQRRGVPMAKMVWSGAAVLSHPDTVRAVHEDYIRAGAEVIITNTFGSTRQVLEPAGFGTQVETANRRGVELAIQARDSVADRPLGVAGSISTMASGIDQKVLLSPAEELESYREATGILADAGADLIALEMMEDTDHAARAMQAAVETGLPIWLGVSCKLSGTGKLVGYDFSDIRLEDILDALLPMGPTTVNIMHTGIEAVPAAIRLVQERWGGPLGVYPESGYFTKPNWNFVDVISPEDLVREAADWVQSGVRLLGGCCGTGPEHVRALSDAVPRFERLLGF
jgi:S-methylmethionine-dependent homocysteine/selenocysteine methylase